MKENVAFTLISFAVLKWDECLSVQLTFELPVQIQDQLLLELEANLLDQNENELEFELSKALTEYKRPKMKRDALQKCSLFLRMYSSLLLYWNEMNVYQFNCHLSIIPVEIQAQFLLELEANLLFYVKTTTNKFWNDAEMLLKSFWTSHLQMMNGLEPIF